MPFANDLQGNEGHKKLIELQDNEIQLLEHIQKCLQMWTKANHDYALALKKVAQLANKPERPYTDTPFCDYSEDLEKKGHEYNRLVAKVKQDRASIRKIASKPSGRSNKLEEAKNRYSKSVGRLQNAHNNYVLYIKEANLDEKDFIVDLLPNLLSYQETVQTALVKQCVDVLRSFIRLSENLQPEDEITTAKQRLVTFDSNQEYVTFATDNRCPVLVERDFKFDTKLLDDADLTVSLEPDKLTLNKLTEQFLEHSRDKYGDSEDDCLHRLTTKTTELQSLKDSISNTDDSDENSNPLSSEYVSLRDRECLKKDINELNVRKTRYATLKTIVEEQFQLNGDGDLSNGVSLDDLVELNENQCPDSPDLMMSGHMTLTQRLARILGRNKANDTRPNPPPAKDVVNEPDRLPRELPKPEPQPSPSLPPPPRLPPIPVATASTGRPLDEIEWFHGVLPRDEVQRLLIQNGDFLVRESKSKKTGEPQYVLSVFWDSHRHFLINETENGWWKLGGDPARSIDELITLQLASGQLLSETSGAVLLKAICREAWELKNDDIEEISKLGQGFFGEVWLGMHKKRKVAVKKCKDYDETQKKKFLQEARILKRYTHPNIVEFIGIAAQKNPIMIVMEFCPGGALHKWLREHGRAKTAKELCSMSLDAAKGMEYLESRNCIHRDLAARNCLLGDKDVVKISDFGMSRETDLYEMGEGPRQIPIKWTSPEALQYGRYTNKSDVWSFGVLLWEVYSFGDVPYKELKNSDVQDLVDKGHRMAKPAQCPVTLYLLMKRCWNIDADQRPNFSEICVELTSIRTSL